MHSVSSLSSSNRAACAAWINAAFFFMFCSCTSQSNISHPSDDASMDTLYFAHDPAQAKDLHGRSLDASHHQSSLGTSLHRSIKLSASDLQSRHALQQSFQIAASQQFDGHKTGELYNVSAPTAPPTIVQAIRLRAGSLRRYGVTIDQFIIPRGCQVTPTPERVLFVYTQYSDGTLFGGLPEGYVLASPVLSLLVYDALNLGSSQPAQQLTLSTTGRLIVIQFAASGDVKCASFDENSTNVIYTDVVEGACQVNGTGTFALVSNVSAPSPSPSPSPSSSPSPLPSPSPSPSFLAPITAALPRPQRSRSNTWKIVVGSVVGGLGLLVLLSLLALAIAKQMKKAKFAKMEHQAEHGETLQTTNIRNSRVPAAGSTRTPSMIERDYVA